MHIAVLEDDPDLAKYISLWLSTVDHTSDIYGTGTEFKEAVVKTNYDLFILDWMLPDINGDEVLEWVRNDLHSDVLIIFCTSRSNEQDIVKMLQMGADDYMVKPISPVELLARINVLARRLGIQSHKPQKLQVNNLIVDIERRDVIVDSEPCDLTPKEFDLTVYFLQHLGSLVSRKELLKSIWKIDADIDTRTVDTHISRLRRKLKLEESKGWKLNVVYQYGYRLDHIKAVPTKLNN